MYVVIKLPQRTHSFITYISFNNDDCIHNCITPFTKTYNVDMHIIYPYQEFVKKRDETFNRSMHIEVKNLLLKGFFCVI